MKPPCYEYVAPDTLAGALRVRAECEDSVVLAGGQSLVPTLNFRLANPDVVIDLRRVTELATIDTRDRMIRVGAMTRQRALELDDAVHALNPLIRETMENIAHPVIRNRGTVGGSVAHADPASELPCLLVLLDGELTARSTAGERTVPAAGFFEFVFTTALEPDELLVEVAFPALARGEGWAFREFARRHGDFAVAGAGATLLLDDDGRIERARLAACGVATTPVRLRAAEESLRGLEPGAEAFRAAGELAREAVTTADDTAASAEYRRHLLGGLVTDVLTRAAARTGGPR
ncbi:FAD binding domain-containing protein [Pseudonocardia sp.]|jgi:carbon-monoxide dehydrogenase medium subunit|uniref:FAD binding domain-containing protein n=1 Tax=Pseudonocardia sp. TaxID=60912 RepID=UPI003D124DB4